jgi:hypothetical protein
MLIKQDRGIVALSATLLAQLEYHSGKLGGLFSTPWLYSYHETALG